VDLAGAEVELVPQAQVGFGLERNKETAVARRYHEKAERETGAGVGIQPRSVLVQQLPVVSRGDADEDAGGAACELVGSLASSSPGVAGGVAVNSQPPSSPSAGH
jgi:hypothetical protein